MFIKAVKLRPLIIKCLLLCFCFISPFPAIALGQGITIFIEGVELVVDNHSFYSGWKDPGACRAIFEALGATVNGMGQPGRLQPATRTISNCELVVNRPR